MSSEIVKIDSEEPSCISGDPGLIPSQEDPRRRKWLPTPLFLPGESHEQRGLLGCSSWGCEELDTTERLTHTKNPLDCKQCYFPQNISSGFPFRLEKEMAIHCHIFAWKIL